MSGASTSSIYEPPRDGLPYLVVTLKDGEPTAFMPVWSRDEARAIVAAQSAMSKRSLKAVS